MESGPLDMMKQTDNIDVRDSEFLPFEEDLNLYLDGELSADREAALFAQLSKDDELRSLMDSVLLFRRMSRQEYIALPPSADDRFFQRLAEVKVGVSKIDRIQDREPLWNTRRPISVKSAVAAVAAVFIVGLSLPMTGDGLTTSFLAQEEERVFFDAPETRVLQSYIYVFEPGLMIEADKSESAR